MKFASLISATLVAVAFSCLALGIVWYNAARIPHGFYEWEPKSKSPFVMVEPMDAKWHGSGVHIGGGMILTAAHVVGTQEKMRIFADDNETMVAEVLWVNKTYDVALIQVARPVMKAAPLWCGNAPVGTDVRLYGNPLDLKYVYTQGTVVGEGIEQGPWKVGMPLDGTVIPGQSGGGVVDVEGRVVGITVGLMNMPYGPSAFGIIVPSSVACKLMGRA